MERMLKRADSIASAAAAVGTVYGTGLGLAFSIRDGRPLALSGLIPMVLIGASLVCVGVYIGFVRRGKGYGRALAAGTGAKADQNRLNTFISWVNSMALARVWALQLAVILLGLGLIAIPLPFVFPG